MFIIELFESFVAETFYTEYEFTYVFGLRKEDQVVIVTKCFYS